MSFEQLLAKKARTTLGNPISDDHRRAIIEYVNNPAPTAADWDRIHCVKLAPSMRSGTLWQGVRLVDPTFPREVRYDLATNTKWPRVPAPFTVALAVRALLG